MVSVTINKIMIIQKELTPEHLLKAEITRLNEINCECSNLNQRIESAIQSKTLGQVEKEFWIELETIAENNTQTNEPSSLPAILCLRPSSTHQTSKVLNNEHFYDHVYGAWLGRCCGCMLGKPVEGWTRGKIEAYLRSANAYPLSTYFPVRVPFLKDLEFEWNYLETTLGNIHCMARDDDIDYTILNLSILEIYGRDFTSENVASASITNLPFNMVYTAEAIAYRNVVNGMLPPKSASYRNPYQEWIGAQIRADVWGYVNPGNPEKAAEFAFRDASYSHCGNGIYGEMWAAACIAKAFVTNDTQDVILAGLDEIPANCQLSQAIENTMKWVKESHKWETVWEKINDHYGHYHTVHVIQNTCLIVMGLLLGEGDPEKSMCYAVMGGWDTDCTGATVGSIVGAMRGSAKLPEKWIAPLNDRVKSLIPGNHDCKISELAQRTIAMSSFE